MKKLVIVEFNSVISLKIFRKDKQLTNCVVVDNTLQCYLTDSEIKQVGFYNGRIVEGRKGLRKTLDNSERVIG